MRQQIVGLGLGLVLVLWTAGINRVNAQSPTEFELKNGMDVILLPLPTAKTNVLLVLYDIGNRDDPEGQSGMAHLAEHLYVTAATENTAARSVDQYVAQYPDGWNAQTGDDYTVLAAVFNPDRLTDELSDAADRMRRIHVARSDLDREFPRIQNELDNMYQRMPALAVGNHGRDTIRPLAYDGQRGGDMDQLKTVDVESVRSWLDQYYKPGNATLVLAGVFEPLETKTRVEKLFGDIESGRKPETGSSSDQPKQSAIEIELRPFQPGQPPRVGYTFSAPEPADELYPAFVVHATRLMMAGQKSSANMQDMPFIWRPLDDPGFFYASIDVDDGESSEQALQRLDKMSTEELSRELKKADVAQTKNMLGLFLGLKQMPAPMLAFNPYGAAFAAGRQHQMGIDPKQLQIRFGAIDNQDMHQAAESIFGTANRVAVDGRPVK